MNRFEKLLTDHSWFREGSTGSEFANPGALGEGWLARFGIDAVVHELNANWIAGVNDYPSPEHWQRTEASSAMCSGCTSIDEPTYLPC